MNLSKLVLLGAVLALSGCFMGELANSDRQRDEVTRVENWTQMNLDRAARLNAWIKCGGEKDGTYRLSYQIRSNETREDALNRIYRSFDLCMVNSGYMWTWYPWNPW